MSVLSILANILIQNHSKSYHMHFQNVTAVDTRYIQTRRHTAHMPKLHDQKLTGWQELCWCCACQQGGTQRKGSLFPQPSLTFHNYSSSSRCRMFAHALVKVHCIYRYTHSSWQSSSGVLNDSFTQDGKFHTAILSEPLSTHFLLKIYPENIQ